MTVTVQQNRQAEMLERRAAGQSLQQIAEALGVSREWVRVVCDRYGVVPTMTCRRCGETFEVGLAGVASAALCEACRERRCVVCGEGFSRMQLADDGEAHRGCRRVSRGSSGGTTFRAVERGIYRRVYKDSGIVLDGYYVARRKGERSGFDRHETLHEAREARKQVGT